MQLGQEDLTDPSSEEEHQEAPKLEIQGYPDFHESKQEKINATRKINALSDCISFVKYVSSSV